MAAEANPIPEIPMKSTVRSLPHGHCAGIGLAFDGKAGQDVAHMCQRTALLRLPEKTWCWATGRTMALSIAVCRSIRVKQAPIGCTTGFTESKKWASA